MYICTKQNPISSPQPAAWWCVRSLRGEVCWPCARPGDGNRTVSLWRSILQMTPPRQKTPAGGTLEVSRRRDKFNYALYKRQQRRPVCLPAVMSQCLFLLWLHKSQPLERCCYVQMDAAEQTRGIESAFSTLYCRQRARGMK